MYPIVKTIHLMRTLATVPNEKYNTIITSKVELHMLEFPVTSFLFHRGLLMALYVLPISHSNCMYVQSAALEPDDIKDSV